MSDNQPDPKETAARLLAYLRQLKNDRGAMADLRCALSPAQLPRAWPLLARVGGIGNPRIEAVAGLFAYHPDETHSGQPRHDLPPARRREQQLRRPLPPPAGVRPR